MSIHPTLFADTGLLTTLRPIPKGKSESERTHRLLVHVNDAGRPSLSSKAVVIIRVTQSNNYAPIFARESYQVAVTEMTPSGTNLIRVEAVDKDEGPNGEIRLDTLAVKHVKQ